MIIVYKHSWGETHGEKKLFVVKNSGGTRRNLHKMHKFRFEVRTFRDVKFWERLSVKAQKKKKYCFNMKYTSDACCCRELTRLPKFSSSPLFFL